MTGYKSDSDFNVDIDYSRNLDEALKLPHEEYLSNKKTFKSLARALGCKVVVVEAEYKFTYPSGEPMKPFVEPKNDDYTAFLKLMSSLEALSSIESLNKI
ncbi:hypothetical protein NHG29_04110 [Aerococcaceae bacterium NML160702]|nr:hypothetical protein [Aerococcaceae bacterium NML160702]